MSRLVRPPAAIDYPSSDGKPLAENDLQLHAIFYAFGALRLHYAERADVYVSSDLLIYYEEGNSRVSVAPDTFVVFGVEDRVRMNYKVWEEGKGPDFVLEVASPNTWREDVERKPAVYAGLGVREYFLFDPTGEHLSPRLQGYRLVDGAYARLTPVESIDRTLALPLRGGGARAAGESRGRDALFRPGIGRGTSQPRRDARFVAGRRASGRAGSHRAPGRRGAARGARGAPSGGSLTTSLPRTDPAHASKRIVA